MPDVDVERLKRLPSAAGGIGGSRQPPQILKRLGIALVVFGLAACEKMAGSPTLPGAVDVPANSGASWGPETPNFNLQVILRGEGFGLVTFRQPNDDALIIHLDTWVRDLAPNTSYLLQRASVDA